MPDEASGLITVGQVAEILGLTYQGADYLVREGRIPVAGRLGAYRMVRRDQVLCYAALRELQPQLAAPAVYSAGDEAFRDVAVMVKRTLAGEHRWALSVVKKSTARAMASNPRDTEHGRLVREASALLHRWWEMEDRSHGE